MERGTQKTNSSAIRMFKKITKQKLTIDFGTLQQASLDELC